MPKLKFNKDSVFGTFTVIIAFCLVCSVLVSAAVVALDPFKAAALANDRQVSILKVAGVPMDGTVAQTYDKYIDANLLDLASGTFVEQMKDQADGYNFASLSRQAGTGSAIPSGEDIAGIRYVSKYMPCYLVRNAEGAVERIILPFYGAALWSTAYGYVGIDVDGNTLKAVTFYSHGETPGLGGEIDNPRWQALWADKKILNDEGSYAFAIKKNADHEGAGKDFEVDYLSGATLTTRGIDNAARYWLGTVYRPFLDNVRNGGIK